MKGSSIHRRDWLKTAGVAAVGAGLASSCRGRRYSRELAKVMASPERVIRAVVDLRPFRPSGFGVKTEKFGGKTVIHD
ncbi:MAG: hypothetical protein ACE5JI_11380 [Acidobacteriota bacterium]